MEHYPYESEFSFKKLLNDRKKDVRYILTFKPLLLVAILVGGLLGAAFAYLKRPTYTARLTFVVDDSKSSGGGGLASLAGQLGFDLNGIGGNSGVLAGDNVEQLLVSRKLIQQTLLTPYDSVKRTSLADKYAEVSKLNKRWEEFAVNGKPIAFPYNASNYTRLQDSLLHEMTDQILSGDFGISKTDKKLGFFEVNTTMKDELLAQLFCKRMINAATQFYITSKTTRLRKNVARLQLRADSIGAILNRRTYALSSANQSLLDLNPAYTTVNANVEVKERDKIVLNTIFTETVKSLESSKTLLAQETPTVQIVDEPQLPLKKNKMKYFTTVPAGILAALLCVIIYILIFKGRKTTVAV
ncbi:hypothetical protein [Mucilaginibacter ginkgonis]|uniref:Subunit length determinant protein n=1 Tax=Mucilaginibacter ginkgonis TaxID=2682091 RepID=A0A6I4I336_9SPHI|nr:hypothetical protein [Mucilaginibacter ginkgonis]QQL50867.1 hypothetical protein GO620_005255 [Mucilaginibacter ginkgonis]